jgi:uncharacterized membrane protein
MGETRLAASLRTAGQQTEASAEEHGWQKAAIDVAVKRGLDHALRAAGVTVPAIKERAVVDRITREVTIEVAQTTEAFYEGPMPPPAMLKAFDAVVPGLANQIADMAIEEQKHRHKWERRALWNNIFTEAGGLFLGSLIAAVCAVFAGALA